MSQLKPEPFKEPLLNPNPRRPRRFEGRRHRSRARPGTLSIRDAGDGDSPPIPAWAGLHISRGKDSWGGVWLGARAFLPEGNGTRLESKFMAATETPAGDNAGHEGFMTAVTLFWGVTFSFAGYSDYFFEE